MKKICILLLAILICFKINAQLELVLKNIQISKINVGNSKRMIKEGDTQGPYAYLRFILKNNSDSVIILHPRSSEMTIMFKYKSKAYYQNVIPIIFMGNDTLTILPHKEYEGFVGNSLLLGTNILKASNNDYRIELIELMPTIKLIYKEAKITVKSTEIIDVEAIIEKKPK